MNVCKLKEIDNFDLVQYHLKKGANINLQSKSGETALHFCLSSSDNHFNGKTVKLLLENKAEVNKKGGKNGETPLLLGLQQKKPNMRLIKLLIEFNASPNKKIRNGETPLFHAITRENASLDLINFLIDQKGDPLIPNNQNKTAFQILSTLPHKNQEILSYLSNFHSSPSSTNSSSALKIFLYLSFLLLLLFFLYFFVFKQNFT